MSHIDPTFITRARRRVAVVLLVVVVLLVAAAVALEATVQAPITPAAEPVEVEPPQAGTWYCPVVAGEEEAAVLSIAAASNESSR
jgi:FlaG/FlaF family flagellin (archaellin)